MGVLILAAFPLAALVALVVGLQQAENPPTCYGIGFGCVPGPWSTAALVGAIFYAPVVASLAGLLALLELSGPRGQTARSLVALVVAIGLVGVSALYIVNIAAA